MMFQEIDENKDGIISRSVVLLQLAKIDHSLVNVLIWQ